MSLIEEHPQKYFRIAWATDCEAKFFVTWGHFGSVTRLSWTILDRQWLVPVVHSGAQSPRTPHVGQAAEILRQMREDPAAAQLWRKIRNLEQFISCADRAKDPIEMGGQELEIDLWLPAELLPWAQDSWGVEP